MVGFEGDSRLHESEVNSLEDWWEDPILDGEVDDWNSHERWTRGHGDAPANWAEDAQGSDPDAVDPGPANLADLLESPDYLAWRRETRPLEDHLAALNHAMEHVDGRLAISIALEILSRTDPSRGETVPDEALTHTGTALLRVLARRCTDLNSFCESAMLLQDRLEATLIHAAREKRTALARAVRPVRVAYTLNQASSYDLATLAGAARRAGHPEIAVEAATLSIARDKGNQAGYVARARALMTIERFAEAEADLDAAFAIIDSEYHGTTRTRLLVATGQAKEALDLAERTFARWPGQETAIAWAAAARLAEDATAFGEATRAAQHLPPRTRLSIEQLERRARVWAAQARRSPSR